METCTVGVQMKMGALALGIFHFFSFYLFFNFFAATCASNIFECCLKHFFKSANSYSFSIQNVDIIVGLLIGLFIYFGVQYYRCLSSARKSSGSFFEISCRQGLHFTLFRLIAFGFLV